MKRALVLSGGGSKGAYQIGVYEALKKLHIKIDIITGTSIGSINGAIFVENRYRRAKNMWLNLTTKDVLGLSINKNIKSIKDDLDSIINNEGVSSLNIEKILKNIIDENLVRKSKIDYGLVTYSYKNKKPLLLKKEEIPSGELIDYIVASSSLYPLISKKSLNNDDLIDGGYYDNLPINLAISMGADEVIAVDLNAIGFRREYNNKNVKVDLIKSKDKSVFLLDFDKDKIKKAMIIGFQDTMKHFKALDGDIYTFNKGELNKNYKKLYNYYVDLLKGSLLYSKTRIKNELIEVSRYKDIFNKIEQDKSIEDVMNSSLEYLGEILDIDKTKTYKINDYNNLLIKNIEKLSYLKVNKRLSGKMLVGYMYNKYIRNYNNDKILTEMFNMAIVFPKEFLATIYLIAISNKLDINLNQDEYYKEVLKQIKERM